jgi:hypothetical protein
MSDTDPDLIPCQPESTQPGAFSTDLDPGCCLRKASPIFTDVRLHEGKIFISENIRKSQTIRRGTPDPACA